MIFCPAKLTAVNIFVSIVAALTAILYAVSAEIKEIIAIPYRPIKSISAIKALIARLDPVVITPNKGIIFSPSSTTRSPNILILFSCSAAKDVFLIVNSFTTEVPSRKASLAIF